jgi:hypothetical protein
MMQTALLLLERLVPAGPSSINESTAVALEDRVNPVHVDSGTAAGSYMVPWAVTGTIGPASATRWKFDLDFAFSTGVPGEELAGKMRLTGLADYAAGEFPQPPSTTLDGWKLYWLDEKDPAAEGAPDQATLADLRTWIKQN